MKSKTQTNNHIAIRLRPLATALTLACLSLTILFSALQAHSPTSDPLPTITVSNSQGPSGLEITPLSLESTQPINTLVTQTVTLSNSGSISLSWTIGSGPIISYENGPLVNFPTGGPGGADASVLQTDLGMIVLGFNNSVANNNRLADEFTVDDPEGWTIDTITFYAYQTGSPVNSTITAVNLSIWDGPPDSPTSTVVFGDTSTNRLTQTTWSGVYRTSELNPNNDTRPIMANTLAADVFMPPGTYWLDWQTDGTLSSGPWAPPIVISNVITTGNSLQLDGGVWSSVTDTGQNNTGTHAPQGFPFQIMGHVSDCQQPDWVSVSPDNNILEPGTADQVTVTFDTTDLGPATYSGELCLSSSDPNNAFVSLPLTLTSLAPALSLTTTIGIAPDECGSNNTFYAPNTIDVYYCHTVTNIGNIPLSLHDLEDSQVGTIFSGLSFELLPGATLDTVTAGFTLSATISATAEITASWTGYNPGPMDEVTDTDAAAVIVGTPAIELTTTVGTNGTGCATTNNITVPIGTDVYYCYRVTNIGDVPLTQHGLTDSELGLILSDYSFTLAPGESFNTVGVGITRTVHIVTDTTNTAVWTATNGPLISSIANDAATVKAITLYPLYMPFFLRP
jgi:hypothetical protein